MKEPKDHWIMIVYLYWLFQFILIVAAACAVILIATAVFGQTTIMSVIQTVLHLLNV